VEQERVVLGRGRVEVPLLVFREPLGLRVNAERLVVGDEDRLRRATPAGDFVVIDPSGRARFGRRSIASAAALRLRAAIRFV
jgi:hypothetical protein